MKNLSFSLNFKLLRYSYNLSVREFINLLNLKSPAQITQWEQGLTLPSLETLSNFLLLFGISADWLLGHTPEPYNNIFLKLLEEKLLSSKIKVNNSYINVFNSISFPNEYINESKRIQTYSLPVRANIVYLLHISLVFTEFAYYHSQSLAERPHYEAFPSYFEVLSDKDVYKKKLKLKEKYEQYLNKLLREKEKAIPVFKIE